jgi:hypothetical protein
MKTNRPPNRIGTLLIAVGLLAFGATSALADEVATGANSSSAFRNDANFTAWGINKSWLGSTAKSSASTITRGYAYYGTSLAAGQGVGIQYKKNPTSATVWLVESTISPTSTSVDLVVNLASTNGILDRTTSTAFQKAYGNTWQTLCYFTNNSGELYPEIEITYNSGSVGASTRFYSDVYRFTEVTPCLAVGAVGTRPPYYAGQTNVVVSGVSASATDVTVYKKTGTGVPVQIGKLSSGIVAGNNTVTVTALVKGDQVMATQTIGGQEGCVPSTGAYVGGGANPRIRVSLNIRQSGNYSGPIGASGTVDTTVGTFGYYFIPGTGSGNPPAGGVVVQPSGCWQTVKIDPRTAGQSGVWNGTWPGVTTPDRLPWAAIDGVAFMMDDTTDVGPFQIYIDNLANGTTLIHDWENATPNALGLFSAVNVALQTSPYLLSSPQSALVATTANAAAPNQANGGANSQFVSWEWNSRGSSIWLRTVASAPASGWNSYPQVDMTKPIFFDILVVPVGGTPHSIGQIGYMLDQTNCPGDNITLTVATNGTSSYTFVWQKNGTAIAGATEHVYAKNSIATSDSGTYTCVVSDGTCSLSRDMVLTVPPPALVTTPPASAGPMAIGQSALFSVTAAVGADCPCANDPALTYQWVHNGTPIPGATSTIYSLEAGVALADAGSYWVVVTNTCSLQTVTSPTAMLYVYDPSWTQTPASCSIDTGLLGLYWTNQTSANAFTGAPTWTNATVSGVDFTWGTAGPFSDPYAGSTNNFTIRWIGQVQPYYNTPQNYTFYTKTDDGARLWVDGKLLVDHWAGQSATEWSGSIALGTTPVDVVFEYFEGSGDASAILSWESFSVAKGVIPQTQMCQANPGTETPPLTKLTAPANNGTSIIGTPVTLIAGVTQESAPVDKVEFYNNGTQLLATVTQTGSGNYTWSTWTPPATGVYNITARTYYNTTHVLNTPANKLTVIPQPLGPVTILTGQGNWDSASTRVSYTGGAGTLFILQSADAMSETITWTSVATNSATPGYFDVLAVGSANAKFYRVKSE